ncbi:transcriptional regulator [Nocardioides phosphati]|uniref:Transcriptional regulator n=2 Tax=Nocardioides phosphati TaxID=1867775 RepID=A0ABQ2N5V7_9ACTN|nr:transcriptional regulator [Nocardioides phosphati]
MLDHNATAGQSVRMTAPSAPSTRGKAARGPSPGSPAALRSANQRRVLDVLRGRDPEAKPDGPHTQAELARLTGLAPATVSNIVRELTTAGLLEVEPGAGRRGTTLQLSASAGLVAGIDFGHSHVAVAIGDLAGRVLAETRTPLRATHTSDEGLDVAHRLLEQLLADLPGAVIRAVGMGLPAPVSDGLVRSSAILPGWVGVDALAAVSERFALPAYVDNDANLGAVAEQRVGAANGCRTAVFVKVSSGIGAGLVIEGEIFRGSSGTAGEIGHLTLDEQGPVCRCGSRGCLEAYSSVETVQELLTAQLPDAGIAEIVAAAKEGSVPALRVLEDAGLHLGWGLAAVVNLVNPELVVVGGEIAHAGELLLGSVRIGLRRHALDAAAGTPIVTGALGERASLLGALMLAADRTEITTA